MWENIPQIIEAAKSPFGITALSIILLSSIGLVFFRRADTLVRVSIFVFMFVGFGLFLYASSLIERSQTAGLQANNLDQSQPSIDAALLINRAEQFRDSGDNDMAREAYLNAGALYEESEDLEGEADVLSDLGDLERQLGNLDKAREVYTEALTLYAAIGDQRSELDIKLTIDGLDFEEINARKRGAVSSAGNKADLIAYVAVSSGLSIDAAERAVNAVLEGITVALASGGDVRLVGFGTFSVAHRSATSGRNPRTGDRIDIPASIIPKFKAGKALKEAVQ